MSPEEWHAENREIEGLISLGRTYMGDGALHTAADRLFAAATRLRAQAAMRDAAMGDRGPIPDLTMHEALEQAVNVAREAALEWDAAPGGMKAGKLLIALSGRLKGYRADIDAIHRRRNQP